ncbi:MAG: DUF2231 domain-containing protein [Ectothiorhodospiraceae bacterium]|nr:DUF2231 domain-containing protein [Ectothiorhodospiraceae bacterium]MCH8505204.1 DUF2231 domain-containing protein [Ectothiorhodospiraceae bacterium]
MPEIIPNWHPIFVHFTIGLLGAASLLYAVWLVLRGHPRAGELRLVARATLYLGVLFTVGTLLSGWYAYTTVPHDAASHQVMTVHRNWGLFTAALFAVLAVMVYLLRRKGGGESRGVALVVLLGIVPLAVTGYYGGELVYRHGVGVMSLPDTDGHTHGDHDHSHDDDHGHGDNDHAHDDAHSVHGDGERHEHGEGEPDGDHHGDGHRH